MRTKEQRERLNIEGMLRGETLGVYNTLSVKGKLLVDRYLSEQRLYKFQIGDREYISKDIEP